MKFIRLMLSFVMILPILAFSVNAENDGAYGWYCKRAKNHARPPLPGEFKFIEEYDCFYIDPDPDEKVVYLTFDAGYENGNVEKTLDILKSNNVPGAFFILSHIIKANPDIVRRMRDEGHTVCNHTATHKDLSRMQDYAVFSKELGDLEKIYKGEIGGEISKYFRPPEGRFSLQTLSYAKEMGYKTIFWSFAYADWDNNNQMSATAAKKKIMDNLHNGAVILLHPTSAVNAEILDDVIKTIKQSGYRFGTLDELTSKI